MTPPDPPAAGGPLVDTHAHLADPVLAGDLAGVIHRARGAGVVQIVSVGTDAADSASLTALVRTHPGLYAAVGVHPNHVAQAVEEDWQRIELLAGEPGVVAIGETGLDRYRDRTPFPLQQEWFTRHLDLAERLGLPVVIHCRESASDIIAQLAARGRPVWGVLHSFNGDRSQAAALLDLGLDLSFAGMLTFTNKALDPLRALAADLPADRIMVETDSPYLSPHPHRGQTNEPARVALTAACLAQARRLSIPEIANLTTANARRLFNLPESEQI